MNSELSPQEKRQNKTKNVLLTDEPSLQPHIVPVFNPRKKLMKQSSVFSYRKSVLYLTFGYFTNL